MTRMPGRHRRLLRKVSIGFRLLTLAPRLKRPPYLSPELCAEIGRALEAVDRGETVDLGDFSQYTDD